jgi:hypothetical protein
MVPRLDRACRPCLPGGLSARRIVRNEGCEFLHENSRWLNELACLTMEAPDETASLFQGSDHRPAAFRAWGNVPNPMEGAQPSHFFPAARVRAVTCVM